MIDQKISTRQIILYIIATRISIAISTMPAINLPPYNQDVWIMVLLSIVYTFIAMIPLLYLANKFNEYSIVGYMEIIFGKTIGKIIGILYGLYFLTIAINGITIQAELIGINFLEETSNLVIIGFMVITCIYLVSRGIVNILIASELLVPAGLFIMISLLLIGLFKAEYSIILPILKYSSLKDVNLGAIRVTSFYTDIFLLTMVVPELKKKKNINKIFFLTTVLSLLFLSIAIVVVFGMLGVEQARHSNFPVLLYTRSIEGLNTFTGIDVLFATGLLIIRLFRIVGFLYLATRATREVFNKGEGDRIIIFIVGIIGGLVSMLILSFGSVVRARKEFNLFYGILFLIFAIIIPILTCLIYFLRKKSLKESIS